MCFELEDVKCSTLNINNYSMAVGLPSSLYSVHVHVDGSSTLYGRAVKFQHDCMAVDCRHPYAPAQGKGRGRRGSGDQTARYLVPRLRV